MSFRRVLAAIIVMIIIAVVIIIVARIAIWRFATVPPIARGGALSAPLTLLLIQRDRVMPRVRHILDQLLTQAPDFDTFSIDPCSFLPIEVLSFPIIVVVAAAEVIVVIIAVALINLAAMVVMVALVAALWDLAALVVWLLLLLRA